MAVTGHALSHVYIICILLISRVMKRMNLYRDFNTTTSITQEIFWPGLCKQRAELWEFEVARPGNLGTSCMENRQKPYIELEQRSGYSSCSKTTGTRWMRRWAFVKDQLMPGGTETTAEQCRCSSRWVGLALVGRLGSLEVNYRLGSS